MTENGGGLGDAASPVVTLDAGSGPAMPAAPDAAPVTAAQPDASGVRPPMSTPGRDAGVDAGTMVARDAATPADAAADAAPTPGGDAGPSTGGYSPCPSDGPCKVLPLGDSITYGIGYAGGYRVELFRQARAAMKKITFTGSLQNGPMMVGSDPFPRNNEGHSGWTIDQIAGLVPSPALDGKPHIVLLMAGTNDINLSSDLANAPKRLGAAIDKIIAANADALIVVAQITPLNSRDQPVGTFNKALPDVIAMRANAGKHVVLVDMNTGFPANSLGDGVHPNQKGYEWMAGVWYKAIASALK